MNIFIITLWIISTLTIVSTTALIGKKYGVEYIIAIVSALSVIAGVLANKIVAFGPFTVPAGVIVFSSIFLLTDILSELWGKRMAKHAIWAGFFANLILIISIYIAISWPSAPYALEQGQKFGEVLSLTPRIAIAGLIAYLVSQNHDVWAYHMWRELTHGRYIWLRNNASTIVSQFLDSAIFVTIAFYGIFPIWPLILGQWVAKIIIALIDTPFMYGVMYLLNKKK